MAVVWVCHEIDVLECKLRLIIVYLYFSLVFNITTVMICPCVCWNLLSVFLRTLAAHITHLVRMFKGLFISFSFCTKQDSSVQSLYITSLYNIMWNESIKVSWSIDWLMCIRHHIWCRKNIPHVCFVLVSSCKNHGSASLAWSYSVLKWRLGRWALTLRFALLSWLVAQTKYVTSFHFQKIKEESWTLLT